MGRIKQIPRRSWPAPPQRDYVVQQWKTTLKRQPRAVQDLVVEGKKVSEVVYDRLTKDIDRVTAALAWDKLFGDPTSQGFESTNEMVEFAFVALRGVAELNE